MAVLRHPAFGEVDIAIPGTTELELPFRYRTVSLDVNVDNNLGFDCAELGALLDRVAALSTLDSGGVRQLHTSGLDHPY